MSLILEALRKSEAERRRGETPDLLRADPARPATSPAYWHPWLLAVPAVLLVALLAWWLRRDPALEADAGPALAAVPAETAHVEETGAAPAPMPAIERLQAPPPVRAPVPARETLTAPAPPASAPPAGAAAPVMLGALSAAQRKALPPLRLSMHLWNEDPTRRVAILDGRRVTPGDRVGDAVVAEIRRDGVLLDWAGGRVLVPLP